MKRKLFFKSKDLSTVINTDSIQYIDREEVMGLVVQPLTTDHSNMESVNMTLDEWKELREADRDVLLVEFKLPETFLLKRFRYFTDKQKSLAYEFQSLPFQLSELLLP